MVHWRRLREEQRGKPRGRLRAALGAAAAIACAVSLTLAGGSTAQAATVTLPNGVWYSGSMKQTYEMDCSGVIWGYPAYGAAVMTYASVEVDMDRSLPKQGSTFYAEITVAAASTPCGGQGVVPGFSLPAGVQPAVTAQTPLAVNGQAVNANLLQANCFDTGIYCITSNTSDAPIWAAVSGNKWSWLIPLKSSTPQNMTDFQAYVKVVSGGSGSGFLKPKAPMNVFGTGSNVGNGSTPTSTSSTSPNAYRVGYPQPSTQAVDQFTWVDNQTYQSKYGLLSLAYLYTNGKAGTYYVRRAASAAALDVGGSYESSSGALPTGSDALTFGSDWNADVTPYSPIVAGKKYYWKIGFKPSGSSSVIWGSVQSFTGLNASTCNGQRVTVDLTYKQTPTEDADVILGTAGADVINGAGGNDVICGGGGDDLINGGIGNDTIFGGTGDDVLLGGAGNDTISGGSGDDTLVGDGQAEPSNDLAKDSLDGGEGNDLIDASEPKSSFKVNQVTPGSGYGDDIVTGGPGTDTLSYERQGQDDGSGTGVNVNLLLTAKQNTANAGSDTISGMENLNGTKWADTLKGDAGNNVIRGFGGYNTIRGDGGTDTVDYSWLTTKSSDPTYPGVKFVWTEGTSMVVTFGSGVQAGRDNIAYIAGLVNEVQPEVVIGTKYADLIVGDDRDGTVKPGLGDDRVDGKGGSDTVSYSGVTKALKVDLQSGRASGGSGSDRLISFENAIGGSGSDKLYGSSGANRLLGSSGDDTIEGRGGTDWLDGGSGTDTLSYASATRGVVVSLAKSGVQNTGSSTGRDTVRSFDRLIGSPFGDKLYGNSHNNSISGGSGNDRLYGGSGRDRCSGGAGRDYGSSCEVRSSIP